ncbi:hypothetical protein PR048_027095 [Dryococelus australis]|uniref:Uncharacterized protein n=1 Tax=Dryococelus australis TaxID=614101 RepID=A0ABQ9GGJ8_9NEOP|nr:hypothetical protein PR048_027095 [Dryococelus australis]
MEQSWNVRSGETGDPRNLPPPPPGFHPTDQRYCPARFPHTNIRMRLGLLRCDPAGNWAQFAKVGGEHSDPYTTVVFLRHFIIWRQKEKNFSVLQSVVVSPEGDRLHYARAHAHNITDGEVKWRWCNLRVVVRRTARERDEFSSAKAAMEFTCSEYWDILLASHQDETGSDTRPVHSGFSQVGIVPDDAAGRRVFSGISRFPRTFIPVLFHTYLTSPSSALKISLLRAALHKPFIRRQTQSPISRASNFAILGGISRRARRLGGTRAVRVVEYGGLRAYRTIRRRITARVMSSAGCSPRQFQGAAWQHFIPLGSVWAERSLRGRTLKHHMGPLSERYKAPCHSHSPRHQKTHLKDLQVPENTFTAVAWCERAMTAASLKVKCVEEKTVELEDTRKKEHRNRR